MLGEALSFAGGLFGAKASRENTKDSIAYQEGRDAASEALQREFAQNGIRWRKADAEAAGLHPLYAIGGAGASFTPSAASVSFDNGGQHMARTLQDMGQNVMRSAQAQMTPEQRALHQANLALLQSQLGESDARRQLLIAQAAKLAQENNGNMPDVVTNAYGPDVVINPVTDGRGTRIEQHPLFKDAVKLKPDEMASRSSLDAGQTAGRDHPGMRQFRFPGGHREMLPAAEGSGVPEEVSWVNIPEWLGANLHRYGWRWLVNKIGNITGQVPDSRTNTLEGYFRRNDIKRRYGDISIGGRKGHSTDPTFRFQ